MKLLVFTDASYANLPSGGSQGAYVIFLSDCHGNANIVSWQSRKVRRICNSTLSSECLAAVEAVGSAVFIKQLIVEMKCWKSVDILVLCDNKSLIQSIMSVSPVEDKRLRVDIASLQESLQNKEVEDIRYVPSTENLANALTKQGASSKALIDAVCGKKRFNYSKNCFE